MCIVVAPLLLKINVAVVAVAVLSEAAFATNCRIRTQPEMETGKQHKDVNLVLLAFPFLSSYATLQRKAPLFGQRLNFPLEKSPLRSSSIGGPLAPIRE